MNCDTCNAVTYIAERQKNYMSNIYTYATGEMTSMKPAFSHLRVPKNTGVSSISKPLIRKCLMKNIVAPACTKNHWCCCCLMSHKILLCI